MKWSVVITMAGEGSRFRKEGYSVPKYEIMARGQTLFDWSLQSLTSFYPHAAQWIFVTRGPDAEPFVRSHTAALGLENVTVVRLDALTDGQATTVLEALPSVQDPNARLLVYNIDTHIDPSAVSPEQVRGDGWVPCFVADGDHWSFVAMDAEGTASAVAEKVRISPYCSVGLYDFASPAAFRRAYDRLYVAGRAVLRERYVAPMYQQMIDDGREVTGSVIPFSSVVPLGTPSELRAFVDRAD